MTGSPGRPCSRARGWGQAGGRASVLSPPLAGDTEATCPGPASGPGAQARSAEGQTRTRGSSCTDSLRQLLVFCAPERRGLPRLSGSRHAVDQTRRARDAS